MFKERVGAIIIYLYLRLHRFRARGGDFSSLMEQGKQQGAAYIQQAGDNISESVGSANTSAKVILEGAKVAAMNPGETAGEVVEKVSEKIVEAAKTARDVLRGESGDVKQVVKDAVETAKGEVKGAVEQAKKK
jgi:flagellar hook-basal body complex protein FliE